MRSDDNYPAGYHGEEGRPYHAHDGVEVEYDGDEHGLCALESCGASLQDAAQVWELDGAGYCSDECCGERAAIERAVRRYERAA